MYMQSKAAQSRSGPDCLGLYPSSATSRLPDFPVPQFPHLKNGGDHCTCLGTL